MSRIAIPSPDQAPAGSKPVLEAVAKQMGMVPNVVRLLSLSPAALSGWMELQKSLTRTLDADTRNAIALAVSEVNGCKYCLTAHSFVSLNVAKATPAEVALNRAGKSENPRRAAAAGFAKKLIELRGKVADTDVKVLHDAGFNDAQIIDIIALSTQFLMTNLINNVADTEIDFPSMEPMRA